MVFEIWNVTTKILISQNFNTMKNIIHLKKYYRIKWNLIKNPKNKTSITEYQNIKNILKLFLLVFLHL